MRCDDYVWTKGAKFGGEAALGVHLKIEESRGDGGADAERQQHDEQASGISAQQTPEDAPEHGSIGVSRLGHHSPRRMGAGSIREARRSGRTLPRRVTSAASPITTKKTSSVGSGAAPKIFSPSRRASTIPSA